ncbi:MAG: hypothetical protein ACK5GI_02625, partial [Ignavibacteria bacterium]
DVNTNSMSFYNGTSAEMATNAKTGAMSSSSVKTESDGDVSLTSTYGFPITATASTVLASGATGSSITSTAGTITQNAGTMNLNTSVGNNTTIGNATGTTTMDGAVVLTGSVRGAGSNRFANRETLNGSGAGLYSFTINNALITANSVIVITLESYSGSGILMHQIQSRAAGSVTVMLSQPLFTGESVIVNYMVINQ